MKSPCLRCPDRTAFCHDSCAAFLAFREPFDRAMEDRRKAAPANDYRHSTRTKVLRALAQKYPHKRKMGR